MANQAVRETKANRDAPRFDVAMLRERAGDKVFARGVEYEERGQVEIVSITHSHVRARVIGSEMYRCELRGTGKKFSGECSCPAYSDWGFCKHLVAAALTANNFEPGAVEQAADRLRKIREHLHARGVEQLVEMVMELAERDPALLQDLELAAAATTIDDQALFAQFKKAITEATGTRGFVEYREVRAWADAIERLLDHVADLIASGRAKLVLQLLDHFFARMDQTLNNIDDSDGHGGAVYSSACELHLAACRSAKADPIALARELFARELNSDWDFFHGASEAYADMLGDAGLAEYRRLASETWQTIRPLRPGGRQVQDEQRSARYRLAAMLDGFAKREGDLDARIAIRAVDLSSAYNYLEIARLCLDHGRMADAIKWAEEGLWQFEDNPDQRLVFFSVDLYGRTGRKKEADELLWQTFERAPSIELFQSLRSAAASEKAAANVLTDRAIATLRAKLDSPVVRPRWLSPREILLEILRSEKRFDEAWEIVRSHGCSEPQLMELAGESEDTHPKAAFSAYAQAVERLVRLGGQGNYEPAVKLIVRMRSIRNRLGANNDYAAFVADLMNRHKAKRNLMKLLQTAGFSQASA